MVAPSQPPRSPTTQRRKTNRTSPRSTTNSPASDTSPTTASSTVLVGFLQDVLHPEKKWCISTEFQLHTVESYHVWKQDRSDQHQRLDRLFGPLPAPVQLTRAPAGNKQGAASPATSSPRSAGPNVSPRLDEGAKVEVDGEGPICSVLLNRLEYKRQAAARPSNIRDMNQEQLLQEKAAVKHELKHWQRAFYAETGRTPTRTDKDIILPVYRLYMQVKSLAEGKALPPSPIPGDETDNDINNETVLLEEGKRPPLEDFSAIAPTAADLKEIPYREPLREATNLHAAQYRPPVRDTEVFERPTAQPDTLHEFRRLKQEKKQIKGLLLQFEKDFRRENGRAVKDNADKAPMIVRYRRYKEVKAMLLDLKPRVL
eukprot:NODE_408_length_1537_cov_58.938298_g376_i0.p1 GENE.NODE_408_length_1537_cov_58.938298_g376_i0~~NODE_408_length_1537_cov_58.938298_g376_i0.p1  ORF type:complete len:371 (+),score=40.71 NODE_408_length_1537_cov_58.938298_g376_i0:377-1489(+)